MTTLKKLPKMRDSKHMSSPVPQLSSSCTIGIISSGDKGDKGKRIS